MNPLPGRCPVCNEALNVTRLQCGQCGTGIDGLFALGRLQALTPDQIQFIEVFIKCKGKIKDVETELGISYPTVVGRLNDVVRSMGYEVSDSEGSEIDQFEYYQAQVLNPRTTRAPGMPAPPAPPAPPAAPGKSKITAERRQQVLDDLEAGKISTTEAMAILNG
jgi:hypothetical protein